MIELINNKTLKIYGAFKDRNIDIFWLRPRNQLETTQENMKSKPITALFFYNMKLLKAITADKLIKGQIEFKEQCIKISDELNIVLNNIN